MRIERPHAHSDEQDDDRQRKAQEVRLHARRQDGAVLGPHDAADEKQPGKNDVDRARRQRMGQGRPGADAENDRERSADHDVGGNAHGDERREDNADDRYYDRRPAGGHSTAPVRRR